MSDWETWESTARGKIMLLEENRDGSDGERAIVGQRQFKIKASDRKRMSMLAITDEYDFFKNGTFIPVVDAIETEEEADDATGENPHHLTDSELHELLGGNGNTFNATVRKMSAEPALRRLYDLAVEDDEVPAKRASTVADRLTELGFEVPVQPDVVGQVPEGLSS